jgi:hypothetical protein
MPERWHESRTTCPSARLARMASEPDYADRVHWERADIEWNGKVYRLVVEHFLHDWPVEWLGRNLGYELNLLHGCEGVVASVTFAQTARDGSGYDAAGVIAIGGLSSPLPDPTEIREAVHAAVADAYRAAKAAEDETAPFVGALRSRL